VNDRYTMLAALKGAAIKCLIVSCWEQRQMTITEISMYVGHDDSTVRAAMRQLHLYGLAAPVLSSQETWCLTSKGYQLPLPLNKLAPGGGNFASEEEIPPLHTTTAASLNLNPDLTTSSSSSTAGGENSSSTVPEPLPDHVAENLATLHSRGIMGKKAALLARLDWVTPDYINAHVDQALNDGDRLGLAIVRMQDGDPAPEPEVDDRAKYISGKYADHIDY